MIKATITPSQKPLDAPLFRRASLALDDDPDNPVLDIEWGFGFSNPGLTLTDRANGQTLATTSRKVRGFPPRAYYTLDNPFHEVMVLLAFMAGATEAEVADFTETVVPLKITGLLASPSVRPDLEGIFRARVEQELDKQKEELRDKLLERLLGEPEQAPEEGAAGESADLEAEDGESAGEQAEAPAEEDPEDVLKRELLRKICEN